MKGARLTVSIFILTALLIGIGCGKKGAPVFHKKEFSLKVKDLESEMRRGEIYLRGSLTGLQEEANAIKGGRLYYGVYSLQDLPCEGCPIRYRGFHPFDREAVKEKSFFYRLPVKPEPGLTFFKDVTTTAINSPRRSRR